MNSTSLWNRFQKYYLRIGLHIAANSRVLSTGSADLFRMHVPACMKGAFRALALGAALLAGCDNPQKTVDSLHRELMEFKAAPDETKQAKIDAYFARLETQIAVLQQRGDVKADELKKQLASLRGDYQTAKIAKALQDAKSAIEGFEEALKDTAQSVLPT